MRCVAGRVLLWHDDPGGLTAGLTREAAANFSFYIAVPAIAGAAVLHAKELLSGGSRGLAPGPTLVGTLTSFVVGVMALRLLLGSCRGACKLYWFAWYCARSGAAAVWATDVADLDTTIAASTLNSHAAAGARPLAGPRACYVFHRSPLHQISPASHLGGAGALRCATATESLRVRFRHTAAAI
ncbi:MAG: undecaprenyl-diphosphate phosphatase [Planctomycetaceae bacterium]